MKKDDEKENEDEDEIEKSSATGKSSAYDVKKNNTTTDVSEVKIQQLFKLMVENNASDLHITPGSSPAMRINGEIIKVKVQALSGKATRDLIYQVLSDEQKNEFEKNLELDFSFGVKGFARFRANVFYSKGSVAGVFRLIPTLIPDFKALNLPSVLLSMTDVSNGLILVTGPTGSGKSTTLASLLDRLNVNEAGHIITIEDPVEFVHQHKKCLVNQREVSSDTVSFNRALKSILRQDPDIVLIGELRDLETIEAALTIAETGHLVFGTLHTNSCIQTINRMINVFPPHQHDQIRTLLSFVLQGVVSQQLIPKTFEPGRVLAVEVLVPTQGVRNLIRENKIHQIYSQMQIGQDKTNMITMNQSLKKHVDKGLLSAESALSCSTEPDELAKILGIKSRGL